MKNTAPNIEDTLYSCPVCGGPLGVTYANVSIKGEKAGRQPVYYCTEAMGRNTHKVRPLMKSAILRHLQREYERKTEAARNQRRIRAGRREAA